MEEREQLIHEISGKYDIKGFGHSPLEREKVVEFISRLGDVQRKQRAELERLQVIGFSVAFELLPSFSRMTSGQRRASSTTNSGN